MSERRIERMVNAALSNGLTPFLTTKGGVNSGYMIVQYTAASMASENKVFAHPASVDTIPSSANQEDFVSMGTTAARKSGLILENTRSILAYELLTACQAIDIRRMVGPWGEGLSPVLDKVYARVREMIPFCPEDRELRLDIEKIEPLVRGTEIDEIVENQLPDFE
jgi:histidine ammonia-lyase